MQNESTQTSVSANHHSRTESSSAAGVELGVPNYHVKFFVSHKTVTDTESSELDKVDQSSNNQNNNVAKR